MGKCDENCKHLKLIEDGIEGYETAETGGYCLKHKKIVYFDDECPDYEVKSNN
jgi:hypothetical protein